MFYLSNGVSILVDRYVFFVQNLDEGSHSLCTFCGAHCESIHILLHHHPCVHVNGVGASKFCRKVLCIHVVKQLCRVGHMKNVKIVQEFVQQLPNNGLA